MGHRGVLRRLSSSLRLLTITINVLITCAIEIEGTELNSGPIYFSVARHTHSFFLIQNPALIAWGSPRATGCFYS
jgi:hypothetical protein